MPLSRGVSNTVYVATVIVLLAVAIGGFALFASKWDHVAGFPLHTEAPALCWGVWAAQHVNWTIHVIGFPEPCVRRRSIRFLRVPKGLWLHGAWGTWPRASTWDTVVCSLVATRFARGSTPNTSGLRQAVGRRQAGSPTPLGGRVSAMHCCNAGLGSRA
jgi:hypothetical protein